ncbi:hypothetical protein ACPV5V_19485 [Vibrio campbellii]
MQIDKIIQIASIVFSTLALVVTASFVVGGEWQNWNAVKDKVLSNKSAKSTEILAGGRVGWSTVDCPAGTYMSGIDVEGYDAKYCNTCIYKVKVTCTPLYGK